MEQALWIESRIRFEILREAREEIVSHLRNMLQRYVRSYEAGVWAYVLQKLYLSMGESRLELPDVP